MPNLTSMLNSQIYNIGKSQAANLTDGSFFHTVNCVDSGIVWLDGVFVPYFYYPPTGVAFGGKTITGRFTSIVTSTAKVIAYK